MEYPRAYINEISLSLNILGNTILYSILASPKNTHIRIQHVGSSQVPRYFLRSAGGARSLSLGARAQGCQGQGGYTTEAYRFEFELRIRIERLRVCEALKARGLAVGKACWRGRGLRVCANFTCVCGLCKQQTLDCAHSTQKLFLDCALLFDCTLCTFCLLRQLLALSSLSNNMNTRTHTYAYFDFA